ncbi:MAG: hypothetical protein ACK5TX_18170 [Planctomyces sp.]
MTYREAQLALRATAIENSTSIWRKRTQVVVKSPDRVVCLLASSARGPVSLP